MPRGGDASPSAPPPPPRRSARPQVSPETQVRPRCPSLQQCAARSPPGGWLFDVYSARVGRNAAWQEPAKPWNTRPPAPPTPQLEGVDVGRYFWMPYRWCKWWRWWRFKCHPPLQTSHLLMALAHLKPPNSSILAHPHVIQRHSALARWSKRVLPSIVGCFCAVLSPEARSIQQTQSVWSAAAQQSRALPSQGLSPCPPALKPTSSAQCSSHSATPKPMELGCKKHFVSKSKTPKNL